MRKSGICVLVTHAALLVGAALAADLTTTTTITSTSTALTVTLTITRTDETSPVTTTETEAVVSGTTSTINSALRQTTMATSSLSQTTGGPVATGATSYTGQAMQAAVLNSTNYYRAQHQAQPLAWDDSLAKFAQEYASKCVWEHSGGPYGENLAEGYDSPMPAIDAWANEERKYDYGKPKFTESTGHYTQLVWQNTTSVGCGAVQCNNDASNGVKGWIMVCEYSPTGNVKGQFRQQVLKPGESSKDQLGFGAASRVNSGSGLLGALVAAYMVLAICV